MAAGAFLQGGNGFIGGRVGAVSPAVLDVVKTFGKVAVDKGFWGEGDFPCSTLASRRSPIATWACLRMRWGMTI
jgi:hypothetical protein